jgi:hypothetical protein
MAGFESLATGWEVWTEDDRRAVLVYRPDVFNASQYPAACLPTIYVTHGRRNRRPGVDPKVRPGDQWHVTFILEPEVEREIDVCEDRSSAVTTARTTAERFAGGEFDYHDLYQVPRVEYLDRLDDLTGFETGDSTVE